MPTKVKRGSSLFSGGSRISLMERGCGGCRCGKKLFWQDHCRKLHGNERLRILLRDGARVPSPLRSANAFSSVRSARPGTIAYCEKLDCIKRCGVTRGFCCDIGQTRHYSPE